MHNIADDDVHFVVGHRVSPTFIWGTWHTRITNRYGKLPLFSTGKDAKGSVVTVVVKSSARVTNDFHVATEKFGYQWCDVESTKGQTIYCDLGCPRSRTIGAK